MPLLTPDGPVPIDQIRTGDFIQIQPVQEQGENDDLGEED